MAAATQSDQLHERLCEYGNCLLRHGTPIHYTGKFIASERKVDEMHDGSTEFIKRVSIYETPWLQ